MNMRTLALILFILGVLLPLSALECESLYNRFMYEVNKSVQYAISRDSTIIITGNSVFKNGIEVVLPKDASIYFDQQSSKVYYLERGDENAYIKEINSNNIVKIIPLSFYVEKGKWCYTNYGYACVLHEEGKSVLYNVNFINTIIRIEVSQYYEYQFLVPVIGRNEYFVTLASIRDYKNIYLIDMERNVVKKASIGLNARDVSDGTKAGTKESILLYGFVVPHYGHARYISDDLYWVNGYIINMKGEYLENLALVSYIISSIDVRMKMGILSEAGDNQYLYVSEDKLLENTSLVLLKRNGGQLLEKKAYQIENGWTNLSLSQVIVNGRPKIIIQNDGGMYMYDVQWEDICEIDIRYAHVENEHLIMIDSSQSLMLIWSVKTRVLVGLLQLRRDRLEIKNAQFSDAIYVQYSDGHLSCFDIKSYQLLWERHVSAESHIFAAGEGLFTISERVEIASKLKEGILYASLNGYGFCHFSMCGNFALFRKDAGQGCAVLSRKGVTYSEISPPETDWFWHDGYLMREGDELAQYRFDGVKTRGLSVSEAKIVHASQRVYYRDRSTIHTYGVYKEDNSKFIEAFGYIEIDRMLFITVRDNVVAVQVKK